MSLMFPFTHFRDDSDPDWDPTKLSEADHGEVEEQQLYPDYALCQCSKATISKSQGGRRRERWKQWQRGQRQ